MNRCQTSILAGFVPPREINELQNRLFKGAHHSKEPFQSRVHWCTIGTLECFFFFGGGVYHGLIEIQASKPSTLNPKETGDPDQALDPLKALSLSPKPYTLSPKTLDPKAPKPQRIGQSGTKAAQKQTLRLGYPVYPCKVLMLYMSLLGPP